jgi:TolB-like protein/DNA-binding winged helix-turn-helix (wHTH) protein/Flp pilus assembly protein TadD
VSVFAGQSIVARFGEFELDLRSGELRTNGTSVKLQPQPAKILALLVRRRGDTVTRDEIVREVWGSDTFVDYEQGLNFAIRQIRTALGDDAERPVYIETVPKRGYRFVAPVVGAPDVSVPALEISPSTSRNWPGRTFKTAGAILLVVFAFLAVPRARHWMLGRAGKQPIQSLAVLPFANLSGDPAKDFLADGLTDELITDLAEQTKIRVVSRSSVLRYKGSQKPLPEIARELGVDAIVEGSMSLSDQQVRITAQLIDAASDRHLWAHSYERDRKNLFSIQSQVAATIAGLIRAHSEAGSSVTVRAVAPRPRFTPATYELALECRNLWRMGTEEGMSHAIQCYQHILTLDPNSAVGYAGLAYCYLALDASKARDPAIKAIDLDPSLPEGHIALANLKLYYGPDLEGAEREFEQALALNPSHAQARAYHAFALVAAGQTERAVGEAKTAQELDPFSATNTMLVGKVFFMAGQYDQAIKEEMAVLELDPDHDQARYWLGYAYEQKGMYKDAIAQYEKVLPNDNHGLVLAALGRSLLLGGESKKAAEVRRKIEHFPNGIWPPYDAALFYAVLGDKDRAFEFLGRDLEQRNGWTLFLKVDPRLAPLRSDPRFPDLVRRAGLTP